MTLDHGEAKEPLFPQVGIVYPTQHPYTWHAVSDATKLKYASLLQGSDLHLAPQISWLIGLFNAMYASRVLGRGNSVHCI